MSYIGETKVENLTGFAPFDTAILVIGLIVPWGWKKTPTYAYPEGAGEDVLQTRRALEVRSNVIVLVRVNKVAEASRD